MNMSYWSSDRNLTKDQYSNLAGEIISCLRSSNIQCEAPKDLENELHQSIKLVCCTEEDIINSLRTKLGIIEYGQENGLIVFSYSGMRVELHTVKDTEYDFALQYLSFDNSVAIPGKMLHQMGMKLSYRGLFYLIRENMFDGDNQNGHIMEEVLLTSRWEEAIMLLSIKETDWNSITTREGLFELISASREFCPSIFIEFLETKPEIFEAGKDDIFVSFCRWLQTQTYPNKGYRPRRVYRKALFDMYPLLKNRMFANSGKFLRKREISKRINTENIKSWLSLDNGDPRIGAVIRLFKTRHDELEMLSMTMHEIRNLFVSYFPYANPDTSNH